MKQGRVRMCLKTRATPERVDEGRRGFLFSEENYGKFVRDSPQTDRGRGG